MRAAKLFRLHLTISVFIFALLLPKAGAQIAECDADQDFIQGTWCPCPEDESLASVCGLVRSADINEFERVNSLGESRNVYATRTPIANVTVSIYENVEGLPTGQPFGNLEHKLVECVTTETEGKYFCPMRRLNPGNMAYLVFSCNGTVADIKIIPTTRSLVGVNSDVSCRGEINYTPMPIELNYAERDSFLGCESEPEKESANIGNDEREYTYFSTQIGEIDGDTRFTPNDGFVFTLVLVGGHPGSYWENDCMVRYNVSGSGGNSNYGLPAENHGGIDRQYSPLGSGFLNVNRKCNLDLDEDGIGDMDPWDENTIPFRYDIPEFNVEDAHRVWEVKMNLQREYQDPRAFQQYNHLVFGDCFSKAYLRYYDDDTEKPPMPCGEIQKCVAIADPKVNIHTTHSFGSRLASPITWEELALNSERDSDHIVCQDYTGDYASEDDNNDGIITVAEATSTLGGGCGDGQICLPPQFTVVAEGVKKMKTSETFGDTYGRSGVRSIEWEPSDSEAQSPHISGDYINKECTGPDKNNCGLTSLRLASDEVSELGGIMVNRFVSPVDALEGRYKDNYDVTIYDVGGDVRSLCSISNVTDLVGGELIIADDADAVINNDFRGDEQDHKRYKASATATYGVEKAVLRDQQLTGDGRPAGVSSGLGAFARDLWDTMHRYSSGGGILENFELTIYNIWTTITTRSQDNTIKSYAERRLPSSWNIDTFATIETEFCISEQLEEGGLNFEELFPPYSPNNDTAYPGDGGPCYPWVDLPTTEYVSTSRRDETTTYCDVFPGPGENPDYRLRTCKVNNCMVMQKYIECDEFMYRLIPLPGGGWDYEETDECFDWNGDGTINTRDGRSVRPCNAGEGRQCLVNQEDNFIVFTRPIWSRVDDPPSQLTPPDYNRRYGAPFIACDLSRAGPMVDPGDIGGEDGLQHAARVTQEPWERITGQMQSQYDADPIVKSAGDAVARWRSPADMGANAFAVKWAGNDYTVTNRRDGTTRGGQYGTVTRDMAGATAMGDGFGGTVSMLEVISHPEGSSSLSEDYTELSCPADGRTRGATGIHCWFCDPFDPRDIDPTEPGVQYDWCYRVPPPGNVDLNSLDGGACNPNLTGTCTLTGQVGDLAQRILGAAGAESGVPASLLLAAVQGEGGWLDPADKMSWDDDSIASYSDPWYARIPGCNEMVPIAQGPFGLLSSSFDGQVAAGKHPPSRLNSDNQPVASKCNFVDAAYAAAGILGDAFTGNCSNFTRQQAQDALTHYRGGTPANARMLDIAVYCQ